MSGTRFVSTAPQRCPETRAHYAHEWYNPLRQNCPGGPAETEVEALMAERLAVIAARMEAEIRPLIDKSTDEDGYDCCGCSTYDGILDHALRILTAPPPEPAETDSSEGGA